tara:strand:+ start:120 stop:758 length:639 start_codon:yes stop_codon:yes gene_type:complete
MKKITLIIFIVSISSYFAYDYWKSTPQFSVQKIIESYENNDIYLFEKHFDIDRVSDRMSDEMINYIKKESIKDIDENNEWESLGNNFATGLMELMKPLISAEISENIRKTIENREQDESLNVDSLKDSNLLNSFDLSFINQNKIGLLLTNAFDSKNISFKKDKNTTTLIIELYEDDKSFNLEVTLNKFDDYWRVTEIKNLYTLIVESQDSIN